jgi:hypothetical protein
MFVAFCKTGNPETITQVDHLIAAMGKDIGLALKEVMKSGKAKFGQGHE